MKNRKSFQLVFLLPPIIWLIYSILGELFETITDERYNSIGQAIGYKRLLLTILLLIAILCSLVIFLLKRKQSIQDIDQQTKNIEKNSVRSDSDESSKPTPIEIIRQVNDQPPLLRAQFISNFVGIKVTWIGTFGIVDDLGDNTVDVGVASDGYLFYFTVSLNDYPIFRTLKENSVRLKVTGTIEPFPHEYAPVHLRDVQFEFLD